MNDQNTYTDKGKSKWHFLATIDVVCPKCSGRATVKTPNQQQAEPELKCNHCYYSKTGYEYTAFDNIQKVVCTSCNSIFELETRDLPQTVKKANCECPNCKKMNQVEVEFNLSRVGGMENRRGRDQFYNLDFWYQDSFRNEVFWAYNLDHLNEIEAYVSANERKRHSGAYQSMVEKLPQWISSKKNRVEIGRVIGKLKMKVG